jgi:hypothetical protein
MLINETKFHEIELEGSMTLKQPDFTGIDCDPVKSKHIPSYFLDTSSNIICRFLGFLEVKKHPFIRPLIYLMM